MSIISELERISTAKNDIKAAIENMGETVPSSTKLSGYAPFIEQITKEQCIITTVDAEDTENPKRLFYNNASTYFDRVEIDGIEQSTISHVSVFDVVGTHIIRARQKKLNEVPSLAYSSSDITTLVLPTCITTIGNHAFHGAMHLKAIRIPANVAVIGEGAFWETSIVELIKVDDNNVVYDSRDNCNAIIRTSDNALIQGCRNTIIPNTVTSIARYAFETITGMTELTIPSSVTEIGEKAFQSCYDLESLIFESQTPPTLGDSPFPTDILQHIESIYVPDDSVQDYIDAPTWADYQSLIKPISDKPAN